MDVAASQLDGNYVKDEVADRSVPGTVHCTISTCVTLFAVLRSLPIFSSKTLKTPAGNP